MAKGLNKVTIIGSLGHDMEVRYMPNGEAMSSINLATNETWKDKQGQKKTRTEWHRVIVFAQQAEYLATYAKKGALIYVGGKLRTRKWTNKEGVEQWATEIHANEVEIISQKVAVGQGDEQQASQGDEPEMHENLGDA